MIYINVVTGIFLLVLGLMIIKYKMTYLIAGYNTAPKKEREKYDKNKLVKSVGKFLIISSIILISGGLMAQLIKKEIFILISWWAFSVYLIIWISYINISKKLLKKN